MLIVGLHLLYRSHYTWENLRQGNPAPHSRKALSSCLQMLLVFSCQLQLYSVMKSSPSQGQADFCFYSTLYMMVIVVQTSERHQD